MRSSYEPFPIFDMKQGLRLDKEPWLSPQDAFHRLYNWYLYQGVLQKRHGYTQFARMVSQIPAAFGVGVFGEGKFGVGHIDPTTFETARGGFQNSDTMASAGDNKVASSDSIVKYVTLDAGGVLMHDAEGAFNNCDINGTKTKVYTKYLTGTLDADSETEVEHGVASALTKILNISVNAYEDTDYSGYLINGIKEVAHADRSFFSYYDATNVVISGVGSQVQGNTYKIKIDYYL